MKLGIAVVYLASDESDGRLLQLHLSRIEECTPEPYTIYAAAIRLPERFRPLLTNNPKVKIFDLPPTDLREGREHAFYLEQLIRAAVEDGATHICTMHVDSFPLRRGWFTELAAQLQGSCVLAAILRDEWFDQKPFTGLLLFTREFYLTYRPALGLSREDYASPEYRRYAKAVRHRRDSGAGYGFTLFRNNLTWLPLARTDRGPGGWGFGIFGDLVFHLGGAMAWQGRGTPARGATWIDRLGLVMRRWLPPAALSFARQAVPWTVRKRLESARVNERKLRLISDPDGFLGELRR